MNCYVYIMSYITGFNTDITSNVFFHNNYTLFFRIEDNSTNVFNASEIFSYSSNSNDQIVLDFGLYKEESGPFGTSSYSKVSSYNYIDSTSLSGQSIELSITLDNLTNSVTITTSNLYPDKLLIFLDARISLNGQYNTKPICLINKSFNSSIINSSQSLESHILVTRINNNINKIITFYKTTTRTSNDVSEGFIIHGSHFDNDYSTPIYNDFEIRLNSTYPISKNDYYNRYITNYCSLSIVSNDGTIIRQPQNCSIKVRYNGNENNNLIINFTPLTNDELVNYATSTEDGNYVLGIRAIISNSFLQTNSVIPLNINVSILDFFNNLITYDNTISKYVLSLETEVGTNYQHNYYFDVSLNANSSTNNLVSFNGYIESQIVSEQRIPVVNSTDYVGRLIYEYYWEYLYSHPNRTYMEVYFDSIRNPFQSNNDISFIFTNDIYYLHSSYQYTSDSIDNRNKTLLLSLQIEVIPYIPPAPTFVLRLKESFINKYGSNDTTTGEINTIYAFPTVVIRDYIYMLEVIPDQSIQVYTSNFEITDGNYYISQLYYSNNTILTIRLNYGYSYNGTWTSTYTDKQVVIQYTDESSLIDELGLDNIHIFPNQNYSLKMPDLNNYYVVNGYQNILDLNYYDISNSGNSAVNKGGYVYNGTSSDITNNYSQLIINYKAEKENNIIPENFYITFYKNITTSNWWENIPVYRYIPQTINMTYKNDIPFSINDFTVSNNYENNYYFDENGNIILDENKIAIRVSIYNNSLDVNSAIIPYVMYINYIGSVSAVTDRNIDSIQTKYGDAQFNLVYDSNFDDINDLYIEYDISYIELSIYGYSSKQIKIYNFNNQIAPVPVYFKNVVPHILDVSKEQPKIDTFTSNRRKLCCMIKTTFPKYNESTNVKHKSSTAMKRAHMIRIYSR
jgi:hypothetical protein